jgi:hypothetical protein
VVELRRNQRGGSGEDEKRELPKVLAGLNQRQKYQPLQNFMYRESGLVELIPPAMNTFLQDQVVDLAFPKLMLPAFCVPIPVPVSPCKKPARHQETPQNRQA